MEGHFFGYLSFPPDYILVIYLEYSLFWLLWFLPILIFPFLLDESPVKPTWRGTSLGTKPGSRVVCWGLSVWEEWLLPGKVFLLFYLLSRCCSDSRYRTGSKSGYSKSRPPEGKITTWWLFLLYRVAPSLYLWILDSQDLLLNGRI